ncbi:MAG: hypothetical protein KBT39_06795 [Bacteroidales bacterium]|nr:hypothetical protein [Bacteroidales bacterium]
MMKIDKELRCEILAEVREAVTLALETAEEKWLTPKELIAQFGCFSQDWLKNYGHLLPRTKAAYSNRWCYPMHKINRMLMDGSIKRLTL